MQVAINAQLVSFSQSYRNAGVSRFTYTLLDGLSRLERPTSAAAHAQHYTAFINGREAAGAAASPLAASARMRLVAGTWSTTRPAQRILWEQLALPGMLRRLGMDVFHSPVNVLPERVPCASVVTVHDLAFLRYPQYFRPARRRYQRLFTARSVAHATLVAADSASTQRDLTELLHVPASQVRVIYPAIDDDFRPVPDPETRAAFRARHALPERYLLYLGTLEPRKNILTLIEAYARLRALDDHAPPLVLAGAKGWYYQAIFERVTALGLAPYITFAGYVAREEQPLWYACATLYLYPSLYEGFGMPIVEALACGTPTLTSSVSSMPEAAGTVATQIDPTDSDALAHAMRVALADPSLRERVAVDGPLWAAQFSAARMATAYADLYADAAQRWRSTKGRHEQSR